MVVLLAEAVVRWCLRKNVFLRNFAKFTRKHLCQSLFFFIHNNVFNLHFHLTCSANQLNDFYMMGTLVVKGLRDAKVFLFCKGVSVFQFSLVKRRLLKLSETLGKMRIRELVLENHVIKTM